LACGAREPRRFLPRSFHIVSREALTVSMARKKRGRARKRHVFTREECQRGYQAAWDKCAELGWDALSWFTKRVRNHYRERRRNGQVKNGPPKARRGATGAGEIPF